MAIRARIKINAVVGSDDDVPIDTAVMLSNDGLGGEATWLWEIVSQPDGTADSLSATNIAAPQFTPKKEGTYLVHLTVTDGIGGTESDQVAVAVRFLKSRGRAPASTETDEVSSSKGWHPALAEQLATLDRVRADPGLFVGVLGAGGIAAGTVCRITGTATIKAGLPGEETLPSLVSAPATTVANLRGALAVLVAATDGGATGNGAICYFRWHGPRTGLTGAPTTGDPVYVSDTAALALTPGTVSRQIGTVGRSGGGTYDVFFHGGGSPEWDISSAAFLLDGAPPANLPSALDVTDSAALRVLGLRNAVDNAVTLVLALKHLLTGNANGANGIGTGLSFHAPSGAGTVRELVRILALCTDVTNGSEKGSLSFWTKPSTGAVVEVARLTDSGALLIGATALSGSEKLRVNGHIYVDGLVSAPTVPTAGSHLVNKTYADGLVVNVNPSMHLFGASDAGGAPATAFLYPGFAAAVASSNEIKFRSVQAGKYKAFRLKARVGPTTAAGNPVEVYTLRVNGADSTMTVSLAAGATSALDNTSQISIAVDDEIAIKCVGQAGIITGSQDVTVALLFDPSP